MWLRRKLPRIAPVSAVPESLPAHENTGIACTFKPAIQLSQDYFSIFGLQPDVVVDASDLASRYRQLQQAVHPDHFLRECAQSQRLAEQQASLVNTAYQTLKVPLVRAQYLLQLAGHASKQEETTQDVDFLMEQMALREQLAEANDLPVLDTLEQGVDNAWRTHWAVFCQAWQTHDWLAARQAVNKLQFVDKLAHEVEARRDRLLEA